MTDLAILIPVLRRPQNIKPLVESIIRNTNTDFEILFIVSPSDTQEIQELKNQKQSFIIMDTDYENRGDYAKKINIGFNSLEAEWYFLGADDIKFHPDWFEAAMETHYKTDSCVIGTNDLGNPLVLLGLHATHSLVLRDYVVRCGTIDEPGKILHEGYPHEFVDAEFVETAKWRDAWAFSFDSKVEHLHPNWGKNSMDSLYANQPVRMNLGRVVYDRRKKLWL